MKLSRLSIIVPAFAIAAVALAQTPAPVVVQAAPAANTTAPVVRSAPPAAASGSAVKTLHEMKAANDELLRKQAATLQQLDEMEKAADQIKIYTKRG
jgi:hypothetical protein